ncbi:MAG: aminoacyl-histidine dipeptidase [Planctomycetes bacterium]|nr:aminoacyl-histidine dipeptidase [Planctomycetota bacterium]MBI3843812.1 aminoacyl-histidine dipeptidase [Planctomycetota bacterium]
MPTSTAAALQSLQPKYVWDHFGRILEIPRPSKHEEKIAAHVLAVAKSHGVQAKIDSAGNIAIRVPGTPGHEKAPVTVLQSHLDMVCEKNSDTVHDFMTEPIRPRIEGDWLYATGTTLGSDNGIGVAAALAILDDASVVHGPLELLFTIDEETGLTGAKNLSPKLLTGRRMINLDSEEEGLLFVGCAGGCDTRFTLRPAWAAAPRGRKALRLSVSGLRGGHSGVQIHENRGNAIKVLARALREAQRAGVEFELAAIAGGGKHNAIPREATADVFVTPAGVKKLEAVLKALRTALKVEFEGIDDGLRVATSPIGAPPKKIVKAAHRDRLLALVEALPHGVLGMSQAVPGLVETSNNVAVVTLDEGKPGTLTVWTSSRSSVAPILKSVLGQVRAAGELAGFEVDTQDGYPGWKPNPKSPMLGIAQRVYLATFGKDPHVTAIHAGLECGLIGETYPEMDMISFGPLIEGPHSPEERVHIESVAKFWTFLKAVLAVLA